MKFFKNIPLFFFVCLLVAACEKKPAAPEHPTGFWEYSGDLPDGRAAVVMRVTVAADGPFVRCVGFAAPDQELTPEMYAGLQEKLEQHFAAIPEMLMRYEGGIFYGIGDVYEGKKFLKYVEGDDTMVSQQPESQGVVLRRVEQFTPIKFSRFEEKNDAPAPQAP